MLSRIVDGIRPGPYWEQVSLLAAIPPDEYTAWRAKRRKRSWHDFPMPAARKKPSAKLLRIERKPLLPIPPVCWTA